MALLETNCKWIIILNVKCRIAKLDKTTERP